MSLLADDINSRSFTMCHYIMISYTCGCVKKSEFVQCTKAHESRQNIKCKPITKKPDRQSTNYCEGHLVHADAEILTAADPE